MHALRRGRWFAPLVLAVVAAGAGASAAAAPPAVTRCTGAVTGAVDALVVPPGASCTATDLVVAGDVTVESTGSLSAIHEFRAGGDVTVERDGELVIIARVIEIGGSVSGKETGDFGIVREPFIGSSATIGGDVRIRGAQALALLSLSIEGNVSVHDSGAEGFGIGSNEIEGNLVVVHNTIVGAENRSLFAVVGNRVEGNVIVIGNDATNAYEPPYVMDNTIGRNLVCQRNTPALVNDFPGGTFPNEVAGNKVGQCTEL